MEKTRIRIKLAVIIPYFNVDVTPSEADYYLPEWATSGEPYITYGTLLCDAGGNCVLDVQQLLEDISIDIAEETEVDEPDGDFEVEIYDLDVELIDYEY